MRIAITLLIFALLSPGLAPAADDATSLRIATRVVPPFAYKTEDGRWQGIAIELWEKVAADLRLRSDYTEVSLQAMLDGTRDGEFDAAVGALSVTPERESAFDFTHPFYRTGLGIAVSQSDDTGWWGVVRSFFSPRFLTVVGALLTLLAVVGAIVWWLERRKNDQFPKDPVHGIGAGLWWSGVTMTTVGYGDKSPNTFGGRAVALVWMFVSLILVSTITASLTTALTLDALSGKVQSEDDLARVRTGTVEGSTSARRLQRKGVRFTGYPDLGDALDALSAGKLDAVVYDKPLLRFHVRERFSDSLDVLTLEFEPQDYAIGLPPGSERREQINQQLLQHNRGAAWEALVTRHLGEP